jgi:hypothetical protein
MAITLRENKGSALTHDELDQNFREFFYSASYLGVEGSYYGIQFHRSKSLDAIDTIYLPTANGENYYIQVKSGSNNPSSSFLTGSSNFQYDYDLNHLSVSGSVEISSSLIVGGTIIAREFRTEVVNQSVIYATGSTKFGDSSDDTHIRTGSLVVTNGITGSTEFSTIVNKPTLLSGSSQIASDITGSITIYSSSATSRIAALEGFSSSLNDTYATDIELNSATASLSSSVALSLSSSVSNLSSSIALSLSSSVSNLSSSAAVTYLKNTTDTLTGDLTVTGTITAQTFTTELVSSSVLYDSGSTKFGDSIDDLHQITGSVNISGSLTIPGFSDVSASLAAAVAGTGLLNVVEDTSPQLGGNLDLNNRNITGTGNIQISGLISASGDIIAFASSDERLKDNIQVIPNAVEKVQQIKGVSFDWNGNQATHEGHDIGVIAQDIEKILPEIVTTRENGYKAVRYEKLVALLIEAVKEQQLQIDELKSKL